MNFELFQNIMTVSDPAGGRALKVTLQTGIDDAESYYTKSDPSGGRSIKVKLIDSGALILAGNVALSTTLTAIADGAGTSSPLQLSTTQVAVGTAFTAGQYANTNFIVNNYASSGDEGANIAIFGSSQATLNSVTRFGYGIYGHGYTNGSARSGGIVGEGRVTSTGDTGGAIGVRGYALDTHAGGANIGLYGNASGGATNYALWMEAGGIQSTAAQTWVFAAGGLTLAPVNTSGITDLTINPTTKTSGNLIDLQLNTVSKFKVDYTGAVTSTATTMLLSGSSATLNISGNAAATLNLGTNAGYGNVLAIGTSSTDATIFHNAASGTIALGAGSNGNNKITVFAGTAAGTPNTIIFRTNGANAVTINSSGQLAISNTVAAAASVASTHKVTMVINGTTYYLLASNV